jgi:hypothetical protein
VATLENPRKEPLMYSGQHIATLAFLLATTSLAQAAEGSAEKPGQGDSSAQIRQNRAEEKSTNQTSARPSVPESKVSMKAPETPSAPLDPASQGLGCAADGH